RHGSALLRRRTRRGAIVTAGAPTRIVLVLPHVPEHLGLAQRFVLRDGADVGDPLGGAVGGVSEGPGPPHPPLGWWAPAMLAPRGSGNCRPSRDCRADTWRSRPPGRGPLRRPCRTR